MLFLSNLMNFLMFSNCGLLIFIIIIIIILFFFIIIIQIFLVSSWE